MDNIWLIIVVFLLLAAFGWYKTNIRAVSRIKRSIANGYLEIESCYASDKYIPLRSIKVTSKANSEERTKLKNEIFLLARSSQSTEGTKHEMRIENPLLQDKG